MVAQWHVTNRCNLIKHEKRVVPSPLQKSYTAKKTGQKEAQKKLMRPSLKRVCKLADLRVAQLGLSLMVVQLVLGPEEEAQKHGKLGPRAVFE